VIPERQKKKLIEEDKKALENAYPKSHESAYSAAVLTKSGNIYSAASYVSDTYSLTLHGEQLVLAHAASHGESDIEAIAITSKEELKKGEFTPPCHTCKQILYESQMHSGVKMLVIFANQHGETKEIMLDEMIPYPWPAK